MKARILSAAAALLLFLSIGASAQNAPMWAYNYFSITPESDDLCRLELLHYGFDGKIHRGEMVCNKAIAKDLIFIFKHLLEAGYQIERVETIDKYDGDDERSMAANNSSCYNYRTISGAGRLSKHALGLAVDINPLYNPYVKTRDGRTVISPSGAEEYADRSRNFPHKIDRNDLCYKLFRSRGFRWGGDWRTMKDYQHFEKTE